jgi:hypothetical protein
MLCKTVEYTVNPEVYGPEMAYFFSVPSLKIDKREVFEELKESTWSFTHALNLFGI